MRRVGLSGFLSVSVSALMLVQAHAQQGPLLEPSEAPLDIRPLMGAPVQAPAPKQAKPKAVEPPKKEVPPPLMQTAACVPVPSKPEQKAPEPIAAQPPFEEAVLLKYCSHLSAAASDGRLAWQAKRIEEMQAQLKARIQELEAKRAELEDWLRRREDALRKADESVVAIYSKMKPDAAAQQFSAMDESGAAAILMKLNPRMASTVLNEIDPARAARIAAEMAGVAPPRDVARIAP